ncbi:hypothetical protein AWC38_SpisGene10512 [Stylophora pistillata]|uniref:Uncharacterized protein n=1 Tax=Stylophora pistillata TaxID=50429 RepID=A0A2B4S2E7_STYPI|nr:hypothetical protein AWC38_SpisGene10512 [Stylophora pistillata]
MDRQKLFAPVKTYSPCSECATAKYKKYVVSSLEDVRSNVNKHYTTSSSIATPRVCTSYLQQASGKDRGGCRKGLYEESFQWLTLYSSLLNETIGDMSLNCIPDAIVTVLKGSMEHFIIEYKNSDNKQPDVLSYPNGAEKSLTGFAVALRIKFSVLFCVSLHGSPRRQ